MSSTTTNEAIRSVRILHVAFLAAIVGYACLAEIVFAHTRDVPPVFVEVFSFCAIASVIIAFGFRKKRLTPAIDALKLNAYDSTDIAQWRAITTLSMLLAMSVSLIGMSLRALGCSRVVVWPFFIASVILMLAWKPKLEQEPCTPSAVTSDLYRSTETKTRADPRLIPKSPVLHYKRRTSIGRLLALLRSLKAE